MIEKGTIGDLDGILDIAAECVADLTSRGVRQWNENYPTVGILRSDIIEGHLHIAREGGDRAGIIVLNETQDEEWGAVPWSPRTTRPLIVHRLMVRPNLQGRGIGGALMEFAMEQGRAQGYDSIRFDVYSGNPGLIATYERMGCVKRGEVFFPFRELPFYCYEKDLS